MQKYSTMYDTSFTIGTRWSDILLHRRDVWAAACRPFRNLSRACPESLRERAFELLNAKSGTAFRIPTGNSPIIFHRLRSRYRNLSLNSRQCTQWKTFHCDFTSDRDSHLDSPRREILSEDRCIGESTVCVPFHGVP